MPVSKQTIPSNSKRQVRNSKPHSNSTTSNSLSNQKKNKAGRYLGIIKARYKRIQTAEAQIAQLEKNLNVAQVAVSNSRHLPAKAIKTLKKNAITAQTNLTHANVALISANQGFVDCYRKTQEAFRQSNREFAKLTICEFGNFPLLVMNSDGEELQKNDANLRLESIDKISIRGNYLEEQIDRLLLHTSISRAAEEKDSVHFRKSTNSLFDNIAIRAKSLVGSLEKQRMAFKEINTGLKFWEGFLDLAMIENKYHQLSEGPKNISISDEIRSAQQVAENLNIHLDDVDNKLKAVSESFSSKHLRSNYQQIVGKVTRDFDRTVFGRYSWTGPVALVATALCAIVLFLFPSPVVSSVSLQIFIGVFLFALIISTVAGNRRRKDLMSSAVKGLTTALNKLFPDSIANGQNEQFEFHPRQLDGEMLKTKNANHTKGLKNSLKKVAGKNWRCRMWIRNAFAIFVLPLILAGIGYLNFSSLPETKLLGFALKDADNPVLAEGRLASFSNDSYYIKQKCDSSKDSSKLECAFNYKVIPQVFPKQQVQFVISENSKREVAVAQPTTLLDINGETLKKILGLGSQMAEGAEQSVNLIAPIKIETSNDGEVKESTTSVFHSNLFVNGIKNESLTKNNSVLLPLFYAPVVGVKGFVDDKGSLKKPFESKEISGNKPTGLSDPDKAFAFGRVSLFARSYGPIKGKYTEAGPKITVDTTVLDKVADFIGTCIHDNENTEEKLELSVYGFATSKWKDTIDDQYFNLITDEAKQREIMNLALAEGRRHAVISHILHRLKSVNGINGKSLDRINFRNGLRGFSAQLSSNITMENGFLAALEEIKNSNNAQTPSFEGIYEKTNPVFNEFSDLLNTREKLVGNSSAGLNRILSRSAIIQFHNLPNWKCSQ